MKTKSLTIVMEALKEGKKVRHEEWQNDEYLILKQSDVLDEEGNKISANLFVYQALGNWVILED